MIVPSQMALKMHTNLGCAASFATLDKLELVPTVMINDLDKSCAKAEPNFDK
jgi:hypothetical protein